MKVKTTRILELAISEGASRGWRLAHKHDDQPDEQTVLRLIEQEIFNSLDEYFEI